MLLIALREWQRLAGSFRAVNLLMLAVVVAGVPWLIGLSLLDALVILPFACLPIFPVAHLAVAAFAGGATERIGASPLGWIWAKTGALALAGWLFGLGTLAAALAVLNWTHWHGRILSPSPAVLGAAAALSLGAVTAVAAAGAYAALAAPTAPAGYRRLRLIILATVIGLLMSPRLLPASWTEWLAGDLTDAGIARKAWLAAVALLLLAGWLGRAAAWRLRAAGYSSLGSEASPVPSSSDSSSVPNSESDSDSGDS